jgi:hypothetical protein
MQFSKYSRGIRMLIQLTTAATFEVYRALKLQVMVFWVVTQCSDGVGYKKIWKYVAKYLTISIVFSRQLFSCPKKFFAI